MPNVAAFVNPVGLIVGKTTVALLQHIMSS